MADRYVLRIGEPAPAPEPLTMTAEPFAAGGTFAAAATSYSGGVEPFFEDDFEAQSLGARPSGGIWGGSAGDPVVSTDIAHSGTRSLKFQFGPTEPDGGSHWWSEQRFTFPQILNEVWLEFYVYFPDGTEGIGNRYEHYSSGSSTNNKFVAIWGNAYSQSARVTYQLWEMNGGPYSHVDVYVGGDYPGGNIPFITEETIGTWVQWREHIRVSSGQDVADGLVEFWVNGVLRERVANTLVVPDSTAYSRDFRQGYLMGYDNANFAVDTNIYIDDIKFYDQDPGW